MDPTHTPQSSYGVNRRAFIATTAVAPFAASGFAAGAESTRAAPEPSSATRRLALPIAISSGNGRRAVAKAVEIMQAGGDPVNGVVEGVTIVENDERDMSVGYGGLPNADGVVELDASVMHGPSHKAGAVASIRNIKNPASVARLVLKRTDHVLLVGEGAYRFARMHGFPHEDLLTDAARRAWVKWKENLNTADDWLNDEQRIRFGDEDADPGDADRSSTRAARAGGRNRNRDPREVMAEQIGVPWSYGTIHCGAVDANGDIGACTTTSGLSYKVPGRVGDSPIIGAGMFVDNNVGAAGATGRGESVIQSCGAFQIVQHMANGDEPEEACLKVLTWIADHTKRHDLLNDRGEPNFGVTLYAVRKDGAYGSATMRGRAQFAVCGADGVDRHETCASLY